MEAIKGLIDVNSAKQALDNITLIATIDLVLATIGLMLDIYVISEGKGGRPYKYDGILYPGNSFFYFAWGLVFAVCLAQGLMAINLFSGASKIETRPLKSFKKIHVWQIWSISLLVILIGGGVPVFALSNQFDEFFGLTITYLIIEIVFRLVAATLVEFNRDLIKRERYYPRVYNFPSAVSLAAQRDMVKAKSSSPPPSGLPTTVFVNPPLPEAASTSASASQV